MLSLYLHYPFCVRKCAYCDFLSGPADASARALYVQSLLTEIRAAGRLYKDRPVDTLFFGGGTPSLLSGEELTEIMRAIREGFCVLPEAEISLEMNPGTADPAKLLAFRAAGISRLSLGVQSLNDEELLRLGRIHTAAEAEAAVRMAREAGFTELNLDLMTAIPGQTEESLSQTLDRALALDPTHLSVYSLILEEGTPFYERYVTEADPEKELPGEELEAALDELLARRLGEAGFVRYEISNYARPGHACRHNCGYWTGHDYLGLGLGAASYVDGERFSNTRELPVYHRVLAEPRGAALMLDDLRDTRRRLTDEEAMEEFMFLGLRLLEGVIEADFMSRFGRRMEEVYGPVIEAHLAAGLTEWTPAPSTDRSAKAPSRRYRLTPRGLMVANRVMADYLLT